MRTFLTVWVGQLASHIGTGLTSFALGVWVYQQTQSATAFSLIFLFAELPGILTAPLGGVVADRFDRRMVMIVADAIAGLLSLSILLLAASDQLQVWLVYLIVAIGSISNSFQTPAYLASVPLMVPSDQLGRANGLMQTMFSIRQVLAPAMSGYLLLTIELDGIVLIDVATFLIALTTLTLVKIPRPPAADAAKEKPLKGELSFGLRYIFQRPGLLIILLVISFFTLVLSIIGPLITPMILTFSTPAGLGTLTSIGGVGMLLGGMAMSTWGGPKRRVQGVLLFLFLAGLALMAHSWKPSVVLIGVVAPCFFATLPFVFACNDIVWQTKVPANVLGKVLAARGMIARSTAPLGYMVAGPLADHVFEPLLVEGGALASSVGAVIGTGPGRGIALMFLLGGGAISLVSALAWLLPNLRRLEDEDPSYFAVDGALPAREPENAPA